MKRSPLRAFGTSTAVLLALVLAPALASAGEGSSAPSGLDCGLFAREKVGRSGQVYRWKPDCWRPNGGTWSTSIDGKRHCWYGPLCATPAQIARGMKLDLAGLSNRAALAELRSKAAERRTTTAKPVAKPVAKATATESAVVPSTEVAAAASKGSAKPVAGFPAPAPRRHATTISRAAPTATPATKTSAKAKPRRSLPASGS